MELFLILNAMELELRCYKFCYKVKNITNSLSTVENNSSISTALDEIKFSIDELTNQANINKIKPILKRVNDSKSISR